MSDSISMSYTIVFSAGYLMPPNFLFLRNAPLNAPHKPYFPIFLFLRLRLRLFIQTPHISRVYWTFRNQCYCDHVVIYSNWIMVPFYFPVYFPFYFLFILIILSSSRIHKPLYNILHLV